MPGLQARLPDGGYYDRYDYHMGTLALNTTFTRLGSSILSTRGTLFQLFLDRRESHKDHIEVRVLTLPNEHSIVALGDGGDHWVYCGATDRSGVVWIAREWVRLCGGGCGNRVPV
eukprot:900559_1